MSIAPANQRSIAWSDVSAVIGDNAIQAIRAEAPRADVNGKLPASSLKVLQTEGYFGSPVPTQMGGRGSSLVEVCATQWRLGSADPALAIATNMHIFSIGMLVENWKRQSDTTWLLLEAIASQDRIVASGFAEPGLGDSILQSGIRGRRTPGGFVLSGRKQPCSLATVADLLCFQFLDDTTNEIKIALIPLSSPGTTVVPSWDGLGMRGSGSDTILLDDCFVPEELVFHSSKPGHDDDPIFEASLIWFSLCTAAVYLGLFDRALRIAYDSLTAPTLGPEKGRRSSIADYQGLIGELVARTSVMNIACATTAQRLDDHDAMDDVLSAALAVKLEVSSFVPSAVGEICGAVGGRSYGRASELSRLWRDSQAARFHPPTREVSMRVIGSRFLGERYKYDLHDRATSAQ